VSDFPGLGRELALESVLGGTGSGEQRSRLLPSRLTVYYVMSLALFSAGSYEEVMRSLLAGITFRANGGGACRADLDAVLHGRQALSDQDTFVLGTVIAELHDP
jgi:hypothetical protein